MNRDSLADRITFKPLQFMGDRFLSNAVLGEIALSLYEGAESQPSTG